MSSKTSVDYLLSSWPCYFPEILGLAGSIRALSVASRHTRTSLWAALQATVLFSQDPALAAGECLPDDHNLRSAIIVADESNKSSDEEGDEEVEKDEEVAAKIETNNEE